MAEPTPEGWETFGWVTQDRNGLADLGRLAGRGVDYYRFWILPSGRIILDPVARSGEEQADVG